MFRKYPELARKNVGKFPDLAQKLNGVCLELARQLVENVRKFYVAKREYLMLRTCPEVAHKIMGNIQKRVLSWANL